MGVKSSLFEISAKLGQGKRLLSMYEAVWGESPLIDDIEVDETIRSYELQESDAQGFVLFPQFTKYTSHLRRVCVLAHTFRTYGYKPIILHNDGELPIRPENTIENNQRASREAAYTHREQKYYELFGLEPRSIQEVLNRRETAPTIEIDTPSELRSFSYKGVNLAPCAMASTRKYLKQYSVDLTDDAVKEVYKKFLSGGILLTDATLRIVDQRNIDLACVHEPNYIQGNSPLQVCANAGISVYTLSTAYHEDAIMIGKADNRHHMGQFASKELTTNAVETELSNKERQRIHSIMEKREAGEITRTQHTTETDLSITVDEEYVVGIFSHLLWDGALEPDQALYGDIYEWLDDTLQVALDQKDIHFIVKAHPAEAIRGTNERTGDWIQEQYDPLPENITFLPPDTDVNTYALINTLDAGVVYASTVGLEMALKGKPVLTGGYPPYRDCGITYDPSTRSEYLELLGDIQQLNAGKERTDRALRFAYFLFVCKHIRFPHLSSQENKLQFTHENLTNENSTYTTIVEQLLSDDEVLSTDCHNIGA